MANFEQAIKWLRAGKKVKTKTMLENTYLFIRDNLVLHRGACEEEDDACTLRLFVDWLKNKSWEIFRDERCSKCGQVVENGS